MASSLAGQHDLDARARRGIRRDLRLCRGTRSEEEFFAAGYDLVVVAGKNAAHAGALHRSAARAGSAVLCEKPLTLTRSRRREGRSRAADAAHGLPLYTGYHYRFRALSRRDPGLHRGRSESARYATYTCSGPLSTALRVVREWRHDPAPSPAPG